MKELIKWFFENNILLTIMSGIAAIITILVFLYGVIKTTIKVFVSPTKVKIEYNQEQTAILKIASHTESINNKMCVICYNLKVLGLKKNATSIKSINFFVKNNKKWIQGKYVRIKIQNIKDKDETEGLGIVLGNSKNTIVIGGWNEITNVYNKRIKYGKVLLGSAIYYFELTQEEMLQVSKIKFIITDNFNRKYIYKNKMELNTTSLEKKISILDYNIK